MTHPTPPTCPECGAAQTSPCPEWECGSSRDINGSFEESKECLYRRLTRQLAERDEELRVVRADNAALLFVVSECIKVASKEAESAEEEERYGDEKYWDDHAANLVAVHSNEHPGQPLLDKLSRLERVADAARGILVECDSELSAQAHGRPASDKEYLLRLSSECRRLSETIAALAAIRAAMKKGGVDEILH